MASSRYYEDKEAEIQPGKISAELRAALNLADNDVPIWIYRMRAIGYPPGWLRKAIVDTEDIFDTDPPQDTDNKSGKRKATEREETKYDHAKLIEYPGFNMPLPPNAHDYHYYYNMPPMLPHQQLDYAKQIMSEPAPVQPYKRSRTSTESANNQSSSSAPKNEDDETSGSDEEEESPASPDPEPSDEAVNESISKNHDKTADTTSDNILNKSSASTVNNRSTISLNSSLNDGIKLVSKGSPMPKPVERLPLEKFSQGVVGELLYFENIPSSTGKFENIRGLLDTMRRSKSESDTSFACSTKSTKDD